MKISDRYGKDAVVFSRSAEDTEVTGAGKSAVPVAVAVDSEKIIEFRMMPSGGVITLRLPEILDACGIGRLPELILGESMYEVHRVDITAGDSAWSHHVIFGVEPSEEELSGGFLDRRHSQCRTYADGIEMFTFFRPSGTSVVLEINFAVNLPLEKEIPIYDVKPLSVDTVVRVAQRVYSYSDVKALADDAGYGDDEIVGWSVCIRTRTADSSGVSVVRDGARRTFRLATGLHYTYIFRNIYGFFDTVYATGSRTISSDGDVTIFRNGRKEHELDNAAVRYVEQNTGYLDTSAAVSLWMDFMASTERYVYENGETRKIIVDEGDAKTTVGELSSFKFKWHYSDRNNDYKI